MRRTAITALVSLALTFFGVANAHARGSGGRTGRMYDLKTVESMSGEVVSIQHIQGKGGSSSGLHLLLKTAKEEISVHLGPAWYVEKQPLKIAPNDKIDVRGSRILFEGKPAIIAAEVKKGDQVLKLRDDNGVPLWRGQGRRGS